MYMYVCLCVHGHVQVLILLHKKVYICIYTKFYVKCLMHCIYSVLILTIQFKKKFIPKIITTSCAIFSSKNIKYYIL